MKKFWNKAGNDIYLYGEIVSERWDDSEVTAKSFIEDLKSCTGEVTVHINSSGGDVFQALAIHNRLKEYGNVTISIEGVCASAATIIACAGKKVKMAANALMMIHTPSVGLSGYYDAAEMDKIRNSLLAVEGAILETYKSRLPEKNHSEVAEMMLKETWFNADEAKSLGFVDEVTQSVEITNKISEVKKVEEMNMKDANELIIQDAIKQAREQELARIKNLMALRGENAAVNAIIDTALSEGAQVSDVVKYIDAVKKVKLPEVKNAAVEEIKSVIRDNLTSGAEKVGGSMPVDKNAQLSAEIAKYANALIGGK